jgi:D-arabinose 1-dehydrogenase-like Zn-dependent alcohol dehydrogenase
MKAAVLSKPNHPLELTELDPPRPATGQVLIRVAACGLCGTDVHAHRGHLPWKLPIRLGHETVGTIEEVGVGVSTLHVGDRVGVSWVQSGCGRCVACMRGRPSACTDCRSWMQNGGGFSELVVADAGGCTLLPTSLEFPEAAPLMCAGYAAMSGYRRAAPRPGERIAVLGIGGLGHLALQIAKALGHEVIAMTGTPDKARDAERLGADHVIAGAEHPGEELRSIGGVDLILSCSSSMKQNEHALSGLRPEGRFVSLAAGALLRLDPMLLMCRQITIIGSRQRSREDLVDVLELAVLGKVRPELELFALSEINGAIDKLASGQMRYRGVVIPHGL